MWLAALALLLCGCPTYEDEHTGTYRQVVENPEEFTPEEILELELFRAGDGAIAMLRTKVRDPTGDPADLYATESSCERSEGGRFDEAANRFQLELPGNAVSPDRVLRGQLVESGVLEVEFGEPGDLTRYTMEKVSDEPRKRCDDIEDFFLRVEFFSDNPLSTHQIEHPVFGVIWAGLEIIRGDGTSFLVKSQTAQPTVRLGARDATCRETLGSQARFFDGSANHLQVGSRNEALTPLLPAPSEKVLAASGNTRYALAHFVVFDDSSCTDTARSWSPRDEPILGTTVPNPGKADEDGVVRGRWALLFVEGSLRELGEGLQGLMVKQVPVPGGEAGELEDRPIDELDEGSWPPRGHFFLVQVDARDEEIVTIRFPQQARFVVPLLVNEQNVQRGDFLPRLPPNLDR